MGYHRTVVIEGDLFASEKTTHVSDQKLFSELREFRSKRKRFYQSDAVDCVVAWFVLLQEASIAIVA